MKERKSVDRDFWALRRDDGKYLIQTPIPNAITSFGVEDEFLPMMLHLQLVSSLSNMLNSCRRILKTDKT